MATYSYRYRVAPDMAIRGTVEADTDEDATWKALDILEEALCVPLDVDRFTIQAAISAGKDCAHLDLHRTHVGVWTCEQCGMMVRFTWHGQMGRATAVFVAPAGKAEDDE